MGAVDLGRQAALRCLFEVYSVPVDLLVDATKLSPVTIENLARAGDWQAGRSVETLYRRFVGVLQASIDDLELKREGEEHNATSAAGNDARMKLLQNLSKTLETALALDTRLRDLNTKELDLTADEQDKGGSLADLDEKLATLARGLGDK